MARDRAARRGGPGERSRPAPARRGTARRAERVPSAPRPAGAATPSRLAGLTPRAAALAVVVCALVISAALPLREFFAQRSRIGDAEQQLAEQRTRVAALQHQRELLDDPAYVASLARQRLHFVLPGETTYVVVGPDPAPAVPLAPASAAQGAEAPWYTQLYGSLQSADGPRTR